MAVFNYLASDCNRQPLRGSIAADSPRQARDRLRAQGIVVREITEQAANGTRRSWFSSPSRYSSLVTTSARELATLLGAGIPLLGALDTVAAQNKGKFRTALITLRDRVAGGSSLADAMSDQPHIFGELAVRMVEVGENAGNLNEVLDQFADFNERYLRLKDRVLTALIYPAFVMFFGILVSVFLMTVVVPMLLENLLEAGQPLPWPTRILQSVSTVLTQHYMKLCLMAGLFFVAIGFVMSNPVGRRLWHSTLLRLPLVGTMAKKQAISRIALIISTLLRSGVVFIMAAEIAARSTKNVVVRDALNRSQEAIKAGLDIGESLEKSSVFPPMVVQIFTVGQQSGKLDSMLQRLADDYDRQVATLSARLITVIEPILIVSLAIFVGFILFATILPILEAGNVL